MLLFIIYFYFLLILYQHFKTSHVIVYRWNTLLMFVQVYYFKTSHVIVYPWTLQLARYGRISKHLMLLFIRKGVNAISIVWGFQNISCYCLSKAGDYVVLLPDGFQNISCYCLSIMTERLEATIKAFQNISCYCLSFSEERHVKKEHNFKTSHVIVYLFPAIPKFCWLKFQNISCYCLSLEPVSWVVRIAVFQNISCYCLSSLECLQWTVSPRFQNISCYCLSLAFPRF